MLRALLHLAKACLAADSAERPRNAGAVAEAVKVYLAELQELLRTAERERAAAGANTGSPQDGPVLNAVPLIPGHPRFTQI